VAAKLSVSAMPANAAALSVSAAIAATRRDQRSEHHRRRDVGQQDQRDRERRAIALVGHEHDRHIARAGAERRLRIGTEEPRGLRLLLQQCDDPPHR
jgi:hypothetical protein